MLHALILVHDHLNFLFTNNNLLFRICYKNIVKMLQSNVTQDKMRLLMQRLLKPWNVLDYELVKWVGYNYLVRLCRLFHYSLFEIIGP